MDTMDTKEQWQRLLTNRLAGRALAASTLCLLLAVPGRAQTISTPRDSPEIGSTLRADTLANLPLAENVYSALETTQPELIADRFNSSGLNLGENSRVGGFLGSWSQTSFRIG